MHVGTKMKNSCPTLKVKSIDIKITNQETYLGDILTTDGKINVNIKSRCDKGHGIINQSISMLEEISFGYYFFEIAMMFRQSMFLNGILTNCEVWYGLQNLEVISLVLFIADQGL